MKHFVIFLFSCLLSIGFALANGDDPTLNYISKYSTIARIEMQRTGIPASIKMAQGILESNSGRSTLATNSNNHFGIKCGKNWSGPSFKHKDDDYKNGKLIKSCFRSFASPEASFYAHSDFLLANNRYGFLFDYGATEYKKWAKGLKKAGYATDKKYPSKLIKLIEKYKLYQYDIYNENLVLEEEIIAQNDPEKTEKEENNPIINYLPKEESISVKRINGIQTINLDPNETWASLSEKTQMSVAQLSTINGINNPSYEDEINRQYLFVQPLAQEYRGKEEKHLVAYGESLLDIALKYGVQAEILAAKNRIPIDANPDYGEEISLKSYVQWGKRPKFTVINQSIEEEILFAFEDL